MEWSLKKWLARGAPSSKHIFFWHRDRVSDGDAFWLDRVHWLCSFRLGCFAALVYKFIVLTVRSCRPHNHIRRLGFACKFYRNVSFVAQ
jgi:hypothetical protein